MGIFTTIAAAAFALACTGDCNGDGSVSVDEILLAVSISLGERPIAACRAGDANSDGTVTVEELVVMVDAALSSCGVRPSPTPMPTPLRPDLRVESVHGWSLAFSCPEDEQRPRGRICVANSGPGSAAEFSMSLRGWVATSNLWRVPGLAPGEHACLAVPIYDTITITADADNEIEEDNEGNNEYWHPLPTLTRGPGCTPTPTPAAPRACCEHLSGDCGEQVPAHDCFRTGGEGFDPPAACDESGHCTSELAPTPLPSATPAAVAPDLVAGPVIDGTFTFGGPMLACVRNIGDAPSGAVELAIGNYWRFTVPSLEPLEQSCVQAPRAEQGMLVVDPAGRIGEKDESNNTATFDLDAPATASQPRGIEARLE